MAKHFSFRKEDHWQVDFWLTFNNRGDVRISRGQTSVAADERSMFVSAKLPHALFKVPQLSATINVGAKETPDIEIDIEAAEAALTEALGARVEITIKENQDG